MERTAASGSFVANKGVGVIKINMSFKENPPVTVSYATHKRAGVSAAATDRGNNMCLYA